MVVTATVVVTGAVVERSGAGRSGAERWCAVVWLRMLRMLRMLRSVRTVRTAPQYAAPQYAAPQYAARSTTVRSTTVRSVRSTQCTQYAVCRARRGGVVLAAYGVRVRGAGAGAPVVAPGLAGGRIRGGGGAIILRL